jgi:hypothetical protein
MPLYPQYKMLARVQLDRLDHPIRRRNSAYEQTVAGSPYCLMVAGVDLRLGDKPARNKVSQPRAGHYLYRVGLGNIPAWAVIDSGLQILNQRPIQPDIQILHAVADGENGLVEVEGVLEQELVNGGSGRVGLTTFWNSIFSVSLWIDIKLAAGQENTLNPREQTGDTIRALVQGNDDRRSTCRTKGGQVERQRPLVVSRIGACRLRDCDVDAHGRNSVRFPAKKR